MSRAVITGAGGFIGSYLVQALLDRGDEVLAVDLSAGPPARLESLKDATGFTYISADVVSDEFLSKLAENTFDVLYHLASVVGVGQYQTDTVRTIETNFLGTKNAVAAATKQGAKLVFTSTSEIYGRNPTVPWSEDSDRVVGPTWIDRWSYASGKALAEHLVFAASKAYGLPVVILRYFNVYGPGQTPIFVVPAMLEAVLKNQAPKVYDSGQQTRCFTYIDDAIKGTLLAAENPNAVNEAINIGSMQENTILEIADLIIELTDKKGVIDPQFISTKVLYNSYEDIDRRVPDASKAKRLLGWEATTLLSDGLRRCIEALQGSG
jgi:nucleoside-diphosphate-sugar epimerase